MEFCDSRDAARAAQFEKGTTEYPVTVELLGLREAPVTKPASGISSSSGAPPLSKSSFSTFESLVLRNLRQAEERRKLTDALKNEDAQQWSPVIPTTRHRFSARYVSPSIRMTVWNM